jgi:single-stranded DNA-binding protein
MNYVGCIVRILETPVLNFVGNKISRTEIRAQFPQVRNEKAVRIIKLVFWGNFAHDIINYYRINDYILVEGYLSFRKAEIANSDNQTLKQIVISVFKVYPLFLQSENQVSELEKLK